VDDPYLCYAGEGLLGQSLPLWEIVRYVDWQSVKETPAADSAMETFL